MAGQPTDPQTLFAAVAMIRDASPAEIAAEMNARMSAEKIPFAQLVAENQPALDAYAAAKASAARDAAEAAGRSGAGDAAEGVQGPPKLRVVARKSPPAASAAPAPAPEASVSILDRLNEYGLQIARILDGIDRQVGITFTYVPGLAGSEYQGWLVSAEVLDIQETEDGPSVFLDEDTGLLATIKVTQFMRFAPGHLGVGLEHTINLLAETARSQGQDQ